MSGMSSAGRATQAAAAMRAISLHAPFATLLFTRRPAERKPDRKMSDAEFDHLSGTPMPMVKRFETRGRPCPPSIIGQRVAFHQAKREPVAGTWVGDWVSVASAYDDWTLRRYDRDDPRLDRRVPLPLGAVLGTGIIAASLPIVDNLHRAPDEPCVEAVTEAYMREWYVSPDWTPDAPRWQRLMHRMISDQLPYGDWRPGRHAWLIEDPQPLDEPVPWKGRQGWWTWEAGDVSQIAYEKIRCCNPTCRAWSMRPGDLSLHAFLDTIGWNLELFEGELSPVCARCRQ